MSPTCRMSYFVPVIDPNKQHSLHFSTPEQPGDYPFICTFPGHWIAMQGILKWNSFLFRSATVSKDRLGPGVILTQRIVFLNTVSYLGTKICTFNFTGTGSCFHRLNNLSSRPNKVDVSTGLTLAYESSKRNLDSSSQAVSSLFTASSIWDFSPPAFRASLRRKNRNLPSASP